MSATMPAGVRAVTGARTGKLTWVRSSSLTLKHGDRVLVRDGGESWLGEVVVPPAQVVEAAALSDLPAVERLATDDDSWPSVPTRAGRALLDSLELAAEHLEQSSG